ncbi:hypothetical protein DAPPUDRAFT_116326 [Daphnia pulex]|uniref:Uncharacterized protein n=1 Tax=Daphnia pulex TaxID=6669 RepID=E9HP23_DAPPU|nr:hypothetical protein DAPPUDRAFT_116326 [Daphnia pulex]|eukprot:EFX66486.1 hypothetical protein DAPPUDRAFT_116326 [Daphnia pulex]
MVEMQKALHSYEITEPYWSKEALDVERFLESATSRAVGLKLRGYRITLAEEEEFKRGRPTGGRLVVSKRKKTALSRQDRQVESSAEKEEFERGRPTGSWLESPTRKKTATSRPNCRMESSAEEEEFEKGRPTGGRLVGTTRKKTASSRQDRQVESPAEVGELERGRPTGGWFDGPARKKTALSRQDRQVKSSAEEEEFERGRPTGGWFAEEEEFERGRPTGGQFVGPTRKKTAWYRPARQFDEEGYGLVLAGLSVKRGIRRPREDRSVGWKDRQKNIRSREDEEGLREAS